MTWLRLDDGFPQHPKIVQLARSERWTWLELLAYCARYRTAGKVPYGVKEAVPAMTSKLIEKLVSLKLLDVLDDGWKVHDWDEYNPSDPTAADRSKRYRDRNANRDAAVTDTVTGHRDAAVTRTPPRARASAPVPVPIPSPEVLSPSSVVNGADDDGETIRELVDLAKDDGQEHAWITAYKHDPATMVKRLNYAKQNATTNIGGYLDSMIRSGTVPEGADTLTPQERVYTACRNWINSPGHDPDTMDRDQVLEEFQRRERKHGATLTAGQRAELLPPQQTDEAAA